MPGAGPPDPGQCSLLVGPAAISAQVILAFVALGALFVKRLRETPQRPLEIWGMDVSKQVVSSLVAHVAGMLIAIGIASRAVSQCAWYFCAFSVDTTLGVFVTVSLHQLLVRKAQQRTAEMWNKSESDSWVVSISECGSYGSPPRLARFWPQLIEFTACVVLARGVCALMVWSTSIFLVSFARWLDFLFRGHPVLLLYFVVLACPLGMNLIQALVQDSVLKRRKTHGNGGVTPGGSSMLPAKPVDTAHLTTPATGLSIPASRISQGEV